MTLENFYSMMAQRFLGKTLKRYLDIKDIPVYVRLGCSVSELAQPQKILVTVRVSCLSYAKAEISDQLGDAVCYVKIAETVERISLEKPYHLIEHLCLRIFDSLKTEVVNAAISVTVHKVQPPHRLLSSGCRYTLSDGNIDL